MESRDTYELRREHPEYIAAMERNYRWNLAALVIDQSFFGLSLTLLSYSTVLPAFVRHLSDRTILIGLISAIYSAGYFAAQLPGAYLQLLVEMFVWQTGVVLMLILMQRLRGPLRRRWPRLALDDRPDKAFALRLARPWSVGAGFVCAAVAATVAFFLIRRSDTGQVLGSLLVAFTLGGLAAGAVYPRCNPLGVFFSPVLVAGGAYIWVLLHFGAADPGRVLAAWYLQEGAGGGAHSDLPGLAMALPIHYISAGLAGCCLGLGLGAGAAAGDDDPAPQGVLAGLRRKRQTQEPDEPGGASSPGRRHGTGGAKRQ